MHGGKMFRRLDSERLENILRTFFKPVERSSIMGLFRKTSQGKTGKPEDQKL
jgi:hypothetical protein